MKKLLMLAVAAIVTVTSVAWVPSGQRGYEGQPGNQGGFHQAGQQGYEGQPGNQSHTHP
jgi:hypothetical protein